MKILNNLDNLDRILDGDTYKKVSSSEKSTWNNKQDKLTSGTNIKTVNGNSLLGSGNITISGGGSADDVTTRLNTNNETEVIGIYTEQNSARKIWEGTKAQYDALGTKNPNTYYYITDEEIGEETIEIPWDVFSLYKTSTEQDILDAFEGEENLSHIINKIASKKNIKLVIQEAGEDYGGFTKIVSASSDDEPDFKALNLCIIDSGVSKTITIKNWMDGDGWQVTDRTEAQLSFKEEYTQYQPYVAYDCEYINNYKQDKLVSGTNIKTVNGTSLLGSGNVGVGVTKVTAGTGLSGGNITSTGTISLNAAASSTLGGLKVRLDGTTLYIRNDGQNA